MHTPNAVHQLPATSGSKNRRVDSEILWHRRLVLLSLSLDPVDVVDEVVGVLGVAGIGRKVEDEENSGGSAVLWLGVDPLDFNACLLCGVDVVVAVAVPGGLGWSEKGLWMCCCHWEL